MKILNVIVLAGALFCDVSQASAGNIHQSPAMSPAMRHKCPPGQVRRKTGKGSSAMYSCEGG